MNRRRKRQIRYDRRKAKATAWSRPGMQMQRKAGHGSGVGNSVGHTASVDTLQSGGHRSRLPSRVTAKAEPLRVPLGLALACHLAR